MLLIAWWCIPNNIIISRIHHHIYSTIIKRPSNILSLLEATLKHLKDSSVSFLNSTNFHIPLCVITKEPSSWGFLEVNLFIKNLKTEFTRAVSNVFFNLKRVFSLKCVFSAIFALVLILIQSFWVFSRECYLLSMLILSYIFNYFYSV